MHSFARLSSDERLARPGICAKSLSIGVVRRSFRFQVRLTSAILSPASVGVKCQKQFLKALALEILLWSLRANIGHACLAVDWADA